MTERDRKMQKDTEREEERVREHQRERQILGSARKLKALGHTRLWNDD